MIKQGSQGNHPRDILIMSQGPSESPYARRRRPGHAPVKMIMEWGRLMIILTEASNLLLDQQLPAEDDHDSYVRICNESMIMHICHLLMIIDIYACAMY